MQKKRNKLTIILIILGIFIGLFLTFYNNVKPFNIEILEKKFISFLIVMIGFYFAIIIQVIFHELGHLFFGLLTGYKFLSFRIGSIILVKKKKKIVFGKHSLAGTSGQCLMSPPDFKKGRIPVVLFNLGGVIFNILTAFLFLYLYFECHYIYLKTFYFMISAFGFLYTLTNGIPMHFTVNNDGYNVLLLLKSREAIRSFWLQLKVNELLINDTRLKDMPKKWFKLPKKNELNNNLTSTINVYFCNRLLDEHKYELVYKEIDKILSSEEIKLIDVNKYLLILDAIYCELVLQKEEKYVLMYLDNNLQRFILSMQKYPSILRTIYTYALLKENNGIKAEKIKEKFNKMANNYLYKVDIISELELMDYAKKIKDDNM